MTDLASTSGPGGEEALVKVEGISSFYKVRGAKRFFWQRRPAAAFKVLEDVSLTISRGETLGLVGESGCGKTTLGKVLLRLLDICGGRVCFDGRDINSLDRRELRRLRCRMQMIFQNPYAALNSHMKVRDIVAEGARINPATTEDRLDVVVKELLDSVSLQPSKLDARPYELSGGERRRVGLARILAVKPEFIVADEPVAALDVSIKAQIVNLMNDLKVNFGLTYLFISHDIGIVKFVSDRIAVMYLGKIVEVGANRAIRADRCLHPYTHQLLKAATYMSSNWETSYSLDPEHERQAWDVPDTVPEGCRYHPRCPLFLKKGKPDICHRRDPELQVIGNHYGAPHRVACHFHDEVNP